MFEDIKNIKSGKKELREFGLTMGLIFAILGVVVLWRGKAAYPYLIATAFLLTISGLLLPKALRPLHKAWMALSIIVGFFVSYLILLVLFYAVITPIGLVMRILGKDILNQRIENEKASYWIERSTVTKPKESYENRY